MRTLLRTEKTAVLYHDNPARTEGSCFICEAPIIRGWKYWNIIKNDFPYDAIATEHFLLVPSRHLAKESELGFRERKELIDIKENLDYEEHFDAMFENFTVGRTFLPHYHLHLLKWKRI